MSGKIDSQGHLGGMKMPAPVEQEIARPNGQVPYPPVGREGNPAAQTPKMPGQVEFPSVK